MYSTYQVEINTFNIQFDKGSLDYTGTHYYGGEISLNVRFTNKAIYSITLRNLNFRLIMIDNELNEDDLLYIPTEASRIPFDMLPDIGNGVTLSPNDYTQIKISADILSQIPLNYKTIKVYIAIDVSCLWFTRHLSYENPIAGP